MKKKVEFYNLRDGQKFRYERKLYIKDDGVESVVQLSNGAVRIFDDPDTLVTPVRVKITVL